MSHQHCGMRVEPERRRRLDERSAPQYRFSPATTALIAIVLLGIVVIYLMVASR